MPNGFIYVVDAHFVDKIEEKYPGPKCLWSCPGKMPKYFGILPGQGVICLSDLGNILAYYLDKTTLLYKY